MTDDLPDHPPPGNRGPSALDPIATRTPEPASPGGLAPGTVVHDHYVITGPGIPGGMGVVYPAVHRELDRPRALKVLHPYLVADAEAVARFRDEARLTLDLQHPNIVRVFDFGDWAGQKYLVMEWVAGGSLRDRLRRLAAGPRRRPRLPLPEALAMVRPLADALAYAHGQGVLHRDLKPENILLADGRPKLTDFGIAKLLRPGELTTTAARLGTAYYMAPEQLQGEGVDARADLYGLGVVLYKLVCGDVPAGRFKLPHEIDPTVPAALDTLLERCLARRPEDRFGDVAEFQTALQAVEGEMAAGEARRQAAEEAARRRAQEEAERKRREEEAARRAAEEAERAREAEAQRQAADTERKRKEEAERRQAEEAERRQQATEEQRRRAAESQRAAEEERRRAEEAARLIDHRRRQRLLAAGGLAALLVIVTGVAIFLSRGGEQPTGLPVPPTAQPPPPAPPLTKAVAPPTREARGGSQTRGIEPGTIQRRGKDDAEMAYIPAGTFTMGDTHGSGDSDEKPTHQVTLGAFWLDRTEVTNARFARFVQAGNTAQGDWQAAARGKDQHPVVNVTWHDAVAYCRWADKRLPTEAEWEYAARGTDGRKYPWGNTWEPDRARHSGNRGSETTAPVGGYPSGASPFGILDLAGNVWEWVSSLYKPYPYLATDGREDPNSGERRVIRGGSWDVDPGGLRSAFRGGFEPAGRRDALGFRCAQAAN